MNPLLLFLLLLSLPAFSQQPDSTQHSVPSQIIVGEGTRQVDVLPSTYEPLDPSAVYVSPYVNPLAGENARLKQQNEALQNSHALRWTGLILITLASLVAGLGN